MEFFPSQGCCPKKQKRINKASLYHLHHLHTNMCSRQIELECCNYSRILGLRNIIPAITYLLSTAPIGEVVL